MRTPILGSLALLFVLASVPQSAPAAPAVSPAIQVNKVAAVINGEIVTLHELRRHAGPELGKRGINPNDPGSEAQINHVISEVLDLMINDILLRQEAEKLKITAPDSEVDNEIRKLIQMNQTTPEEFEARLAAQGGSMDLLRERIRNSILSQRIVGYMISRKVVVTKEEIARYYEEHKSEFTSQKSVDISLIVFGPTADADAVAERISKGSLSFEQAAKQYSIGPEAEAGGGLGYIPLKDLAPPLRAEVAGLSDRQVSAVFDLDVHKAMIRLNGATAGSQMDLEEASPEIEQILREPRLQTRFEDYIKQLRSRAVIDIRL